MNQKLAIILFTFALVVAVVVGFGPKEEERVPPAAVRAKVLDSFRKTRESESPTPGTSRRIPERTPASGDRVVQSAPVSVGEPLSAESFSRKYGEKTIYQSHQNRVVRIEATPNRMEELAPDQKTRDFRSSSSPALIERAQEILSNSRDILGINPRTEFLPAVANPGELSGQVTFQQAIGGVPVSPGGLVTIVMGSEGELRTVDSSIYPVVEIASQRQGPAPAFHREILYVTQSSPVAVVRYAYESRSEGIQKVVDAGSGDILFERDRRIR